MSSLIRNTMKKVGFLCPSTEVGEARKPRAKGVISVCRNGAWGDDNRSLDPSIAVIPCKQRASTQALRTTQVYMCTRAIPGSLVWKGDNRYHGKGKNFSHADSTERASLRGLEHVFFFFFSLSPRYEEWRMEYSVRTGW